MNVYIPKIVMENTLLILIGVLYKLFWEGDYRAVPGLVGWNLLALIVVVVVCQIMKGCGVILRQNPWNTEDTGGAMDPWIVLQFDFNYEAVQQYQPQVNYLLMMMLIVTSLLVGSAIGLYHARYWVS